MFRIAIVDDDPGDAAALQQYIAAYAQDKAAMRRAPLAAHTLRVFASGDEFLASFPAEYDAVFLDIDMPGTSGMRAAQLLRKDNNDAAIIFVTNMAKYALAGYSVRALDFIVKPVSYRDFALKFAKVIEYCRRNASRTIALRPGESEQVNVESADILYIEVIQHYLLYHMANGDCHRVRGTIGEAEARLAPYAFARASKSFLVNLRHVRSITGQAVDVGGETVYIGRTKRDAFLSAFGRHVGGFR